MVAAVETIGRGAPRREFPKNLALEASLLGAVLRDNDVLHHLREVETDDFFDARHKAVWSAIRNLRADERPVDVVTVQAELDGAGKLDSIGGPAFLGELVLNCPTIDNVKEYRDTVRLLSRHRRAIIELGSAYERAWNWPHDPAELVSELTGQLQRIETLKAPKRSRLITVADALEDLIVNVGRAPVYPSPFPTLNEAIGHGGFMGTQVYTVAAGTGRGKTTWVAAVAAHAAQTVPVIVATYEMKPGYFVARKAASVLGRHSNSIIRGDVPIADVLRAVPYPRLFLLHKPTLAELREEVELVTERYGQAPLLVVDYLQKLANQIAATQARPDLRIATTLASETLCDIAEQTGAAVIAVSAIGRGKGKIMTTPRKFEPYELVEVAKESGAVEYDGAGLIVLTLSSEKDADGSRVATMTLAKVRFGEECHIDARYHGARGLWVDCGRVSEDEIATPEPDSDDALRIRVAKSLNDKPARNAKELVARVTGNKQRLYAVVKEMRAESLIDKVGTGLALTEQGRSLLMGVV